MSDSLLYQQIYKAELVLQPLKESLHRYGSELKGSLKRLQDSQHCLLL